MIMKISIIELPWPEFNSHSQRHHRSLSAMASWGSPRPAIAMKQDSTELFIATLLAGLIAHPLKISKYNIDSGKEVAWIYKGTGGRTVLTVATQVITKNPKVSVSQEAQSWVLIIKSLTKKDQGIYMCQVNTKPARNLLGSIHVVVPPTIDDSRSSGDVTVDEGKDVSMTCEARGDPPPVIRWVREGGERFNMNTSQTGLKISYNNKEIQYIHDLLDEYLGKTLFIPGVSRNHSGAFLCIASNGVPPSVSKRILLNVNFPPKILDEHASGRVGAALLGVATMTCKFQAQPLTAVRWFKGPREVKGQSASAVVETSKGQFMLEE
ncbi:neurotrimin-like [Penaeus indicus]|uniref:neurotrimin-like n=1 Tax=Penaeus indicus TaxID=29960 RepID=UPI00300DB679